MMKKSRDLAGMLFDRWQVLPQVRYKKGRRQWLCVCSCEEHTEKYVDEQNLLKGQSKSCGCLSKEMSRERYIDLTDQHFGDLEVISKAENKKGRVAWNCKCSCGKEKIMTSHDLLCDGRKNCGGKVHIIGKHIRNLTSMDLGVMEALYPTEKRSNKGSVIWQCRCKKCGQEKELSEDALVHGNYKSCGCTRFEHSAQMSKYRHFYNGTCLEALKRKKRCDNKTGVIGVVKTSSGKYRASISFQGESYRLGSYKTLTEAAMVRKKAEETLHQPFIQAYTSWMQDEEETRKEFVFEVNFADGEFQIRSNYL
ncbi:MAG: hypothetical protein PHX08_11800 [Lachnospiraceae bacterium]|nr:hypothetical protein [Lachnospiraceae bacterium]